MTNYLWEMRPYFRQVAGELVLGSVAGIVMNTAVVLPAILLGRAIDTALAFEQGQASAGAVGLAALAYFGGVALTEGPRIGKRWWLMTANGRIRANVRANALRGVMAWPMPRLDATPVGDFMARIIGDVEVLGVGVREFIIETWDTVLFSISLVVAMLAYDVPLTLMALLPVPVAMLLAKASGRWVAGRVTASREANSSLIAAIQEQLSAIRVLRLFGRSNAAVERVERLSEGQAAANRAIVRLRAGLRPVYTTLMTAGVLWVVWQGGHNVIDGIMTVGALVAFLQLHLRFVNRGFRIPQLVNSIQSGGAAYRRLRPLLAPPLPVSQEPPYASFRPSHLAGIAEPARPALSIARGPVALSLQGVTFKYTGAQRPALNGIALDIAAGALLAVTGPVGCGKSALAQVLLGFYPLEEGHVLWNGSSIDQIAPLERTTRMGYLPQNPFLFSGSVLENILPRSMVETSEARAIVEMAIHCAALEEDLRSFPEGLDTLIGERGIRVSGGQRQRIALARAIANSYPEAPGLLILDDPFSAVDLDTEYKIVSRLEEAFGPKASLERRCTVVLFSHRLAIFPQADRVVVLRDGQVAETGTHAELLHKQGLYSRIYRAQMISGGLSTVENAAK